jgi:hypothetical protein
MNTDNIPQWAIIELMGHIRYGGLVSKDTQLGTSMLRVDVPEGETFVSQLVNPSSIYRLTMCSEQLARAACAGNSHRPLNSWEMPSPKIAITAENDGEENEDIFFTSREADPIDPEQGHYASP